MSQNADTKVVGKAFKVEINGQFVPAKSFSGGAPLVEKPLPIKGELTKTSETTMAKPALSELVITSFITPACKVLTDAAKAVANQGKNERFNITITEMSKNGSSVVRTTVYKNCLLTSLDFPTLIPKGPGIVYETATFLPETVYIKK